MNLTFTRILISLPLLMTSLVVAGCKKDEPPPPLPAATAAPAQEPSPVLALDPVPDVPPDAGTPTPKRAGGGASPSGNMQACCNALAQNAASAPPDTAPYLQQASATCSFLAAQGKDKGSVVAAIAGMLKGAGMPAACK